MDEPLDSINAKRRIRHIIDNGTVQWTNHALQRLSERRLTTVDCVNVLRAGVVDWPEFQNGTWRYSVRVGWITVVIAFRSEETLARKNHRGGRKRLLLMA